LPIDSVDVVYDSVQKDPKAGEKAYKKLKNGGTFVSLCNSLPPGVTCGAPLPNALTRLKRLKVRTETHRCVPGCASTKNLNYLKELVEAGKLRTRIDTAYDLPSVPDAVQKYTEGRTVGKIAIRVSSNKSCTV